MNNLPGFPDLDLYAEVILTQLLEQGKLKRESLYLLAQGLQKRGYAKDVQEVTRDQHADGSVRTVVKLNREGIYDMLPEAVCHQPIPRNPQISTQQTKARFEQRKREETEGRKFFQPLEQALYQQRIDIVLNEQQWLPELSALAAYQLINQFIDADLSFTYNEALTLQYIFPRLHKMPADRSLSSQYIALLLQLPVRIQRKTTMNDHEQHAGKLGEDILGINSTLNACYEEQVFTIQLLDATHEKVNEILVRKRDLLNLVKDLFFPAGAEVVIATSFCKRSGDFTPGYSSASSRLGFTTIL